MIRIKNTLNSKIQNITNKNINWYTCGPTVSDHSHLGHARNYIMNDIIKRIFERFEYNINLVMNITNVDDKIINKAYMEKVTYKDISQKFEQSFWEDMDNLNIQRPNTVTRVDEYMDKIIQFVQDIIDNGYAYQSDGSVYFDSQKFNVDFTTYFEQKSNNYEIEDSEFTKYKKHKNDFALWKKSKEGEIAWESQFGDGRPGWHIECSSMCCSIFGDTLDLHSGGIDLKFSHHSNEIKQCMAKYKKEWCKYFLHIGHLHIDKLKMSKSLKNFITIKDVLKTYSSNQIRFLFANHQYDEPMDFSYSRLDQTNIDLETILNFIKNIGGNIKNNRRNDYYFDLTKYKTKIEKMLLTNFNTAGVIKVLMDMIKNINPNLEKMGLDKLDQTRSFVLNLMNTFGIDLETKGDLTTEKYIDEFIKFRDTIRLWAFENKQFELLQLTDKVRNETLLNLDVIVEDKGKNPSTWKWN
jgi:cysteinyl-tRNA synthetase